MAYKQKGFPMHTTSSALKQTTYNPTEEDYLKANPGEITAFSPEPPKGSASHEIWKVAKTEETKRMIKKGKEADRRVPMEQTEKQIKAGLTPTDTL